MLLLWPGTGGRGICAAKVAEGADVSLAAGLAAHLTVSRNGAVPTQHLHPAEHWAVSTTALPWRQRKGSVNEVQPPRGIGDQWVQQNCRISKNHSPSQKNTTNLENVCCHPTWKKPESRCHGSREVSFSECNVTWTSKGGTLLSFGNNATWYIMWLLRLLILVLAPFSTSRSILFFANNTTTNRQCIYMELRPCPHKTRLFCNRGFVI